MSEGLDIDPDGFVLRLDVRVSDPGRAGEIAETLGRIAAGYAVEGHVASMLCHPDRLVIDIDVDVGFDPEEDP